MVLTDSHSFIDNTIILINTIYSIYYTNPNIDPLHLCYVEILDDNKVIILPFQKIASSISVNVCELTLPDKHLLTSNINL